MSEDTNIVLEGHYKNENINFDSQEGLVWVGKKIKDNYSNFFYGDNVTSVVKLDAKESSLSASATFWFGLSGYLATAGVQDYLVEVTWASGLKSLIKIRGGVYELILRNMHNDMPKIDREAVYNEAIALYEINDYFKVCAALRKFYTIRDYKDSEEYIKKCEQKRQEYSWQHREATKKGSKYINNFFLAVTIGAGLLAAGAFALHVTAAGVCLAIGSVCSLIIMLAFRSANK